VPDGWPSREQPRLTLAGAAGAAAPPPADEDESVDGETLALVRANDEELTRLDPCDRVSAAGLTEICAALARNTAVTDLRLAHGAFRNAGVAPLARLLRDNRSITSLELRFNGLTEIQPIAAALERNRSLTFLGLDGNLLGDAGALALARSLVANGSLRTLHMRCAGVRASGLRALARAMESNTTLTQLALRNEDTSFEDEYGSGDDEETVVLEPSLLQRIHTALARNRLLPILPRLRCSDAALDTLEFGVPPLGNAGCIALGAALAGNTSLTRLTMRHSGIGDEGAAALARALPDSRLLRLTLSDNMLEDEAVVALTAGLARCSGLLELNLMSEGISAAGARSVASLLAASSTLRGLSVFGNSAIGDVGASALAAAMATSTSLKGLAVGACGITCAGANALAAALAHSNSLTNLRISNNPIRGDGALALAAPLATHGTLTLLYASKCALGDVGAKAIARALASSKVLERLDLAENGISDVGGMALANALLSNASSALLNLELKTNQLGDGSAAAFANVLVNGATRLEGLCLFDNAVGDVGAVALAAALRLNTSLKHIRLDRNNLQAAGKEALRDAAALRPALCLSAY
jgi:Ran GTPase-activating protein (RanGAP) involved in mRNA processing and transport